MLRCHYIILFEFLLFLFLKIENKWTLLHRNKLIQSSSITEKLEQKKGDRKEFINCCSIILSSINTYTLCTQNPAYPDTLKDFHDKRAADDKKTTDKQRQIQFDRGI